jgi:hypothetical protein
MREDGLPLALATLALSMSDDARTSLVLSGCGAPLPLPLPLSPPRELLGPFSIASRPRTRLPFLDPSYMLSR